MKRFMIAVVVCLLMLASFLSWSEQQSGSEPFPYDPDEVVDLQLRDHHISLRREDDRAKDIMEDLRLEARRVATEEQAANDLRLWVEAEEARLEAERVAAEAERERLAEEQRQQAEQQASLAPAQPAGSVWDRLAQCESSGNWSINTGNGYSGGLQWLHDTWVRAGGLAYAPTAWQATREQEIAVAEAWLARTSWAQWPACARSLGLR